MFWLIHPWPETIFWVTEGQWLYHSQLNIHLIKKKSNKLKLMCKHIYGIRRPICFKCILNRGPLNWWHKNNNKTCRHFCGSCQISSKKMLSKQLTLKIENIQILLVLKILKKYFNTGYMLSHCPSQEGILDLYYCGPQSSQCFCFHYTWESINLYEKLKFQKE